MPSFHNQDGKCLSMGQQTGKILNVHAIFYFNILVKFSMRGTSFSKILNHSSHCTWIKSATLYRYKM